MATERKTDALDAAIAALSADAEDKNPDDVTVGGFQFEPPITGGKTAKRTTRNKARKSTSRKTESNPVLDTVSAFGTTAWGLGGYALSETGPKELQPVGRMMQIQSPAAGKHIANIIDKTPLMTWLSPLAASSGLIGEIAALIMPPLLVGIVATRPKLGEAARPVITALLVPIAKDIMQAQQEQSDAVSNMTEIDEDTVNAVNQMISLIFGAKEDESADS